MQSCGVQKDFEGETEEKRHNLTNSGRGEWTMDGSPRDIYINPACKAHQDWLRSWCRAHWLSTFKRSLVYGNKLSYHACCNSFSRRGFSKVAGHPPLLSMGVLQIPGLRNATSHEDLLQWLLDIVMESTHQGQRVLFPSLNRHHIDREEIEEVTGRETEQEKLLTKRNTDLERELDKAMKQVTELKKHNEQLFQSSKSWYSKYEQLLDNGTAIFTLMTPKKHRTNDVFEFTED